MSEIITLKDGQKRQTRRVPKYVMWRHGRSASIFYHRIEEIIIGQPKLAPQEQAATLLRNLTDEEGAQFEALADDIVSHSFDPPVDAEQVPPTDYWKLFNRTFYGMPDTPVETTEGVTTVDAVEKFSDESELPQAGENLPHVSGDESSAAHGHP